MAADELTALRARRKSIMGKIKRRGAKLWEMKFDIQNLEGELAAVEREIELERDVRKI